MHVGTDFLKLPPVTGQYWSLFQCSMLGTSGTCVPQRRSRLDLYAVLDGEGHEGRDVAARGAAVTGG